MKEIKINNFIKKQKRIILPIIIIELLIYVGLIMMCCTNLISMIFPENMIRSVAGTVKEHQYTGVDLSLSLDEQFQSAVYYFEIYENGILTEREIIASSSSEVTQQEFVLLPRGNEIGRYDKIDMRITNDLEGYKATTYFMPMVWEGSFEQNILEDRRMVIEPGQDIVLNIMCFQSVENAKETSKISCQKFNEFSKEEQQKILEEKEFAVVLRGRYSDFPTEETRKLIEL